MSVCNWIVLASQKTIEKAEARSGYGECWFHALPEPIAAIIIEFGDGNDTFPDGTPTYEYLKNIKGKDLQADLAILEKCVPFISDDVDFAQIEHICRSRPELRIWFHSE